MPAATLVPCLSFFSCLESVSPMEAYHMFLRFVSSTPNEIISDGGLFLCGKIVLFYFDMFCIYVTISHNVVSNISGL